MDIEGRVRMPRASRPRREGKMKKAIDEMRAWLEEKREELMLPVKLSGYPPTKWHIERNEIIDSILAELAEKKITRDQIEQLSYSFEWKDKDELRERIIPEQLARVLGLLPGAKCDDCMLKRKAALEKRPTISKMPDGWWLHITGKDGKMADVFLGPNHGPIVESVLNDNADKGNVPVFNEEGNSNE